MNKIKDVNINGVQIINKIKDKVSYELYKLRVNKEFRDSYADFLKNGTTSPDGY